AFSDDDVAARELEPAVEPLREAERGSRRHRADRMAAVRIDARCRRAMEIGDAQRVLSRRHAETVANGALVDAFARGKEAPAQISNRTDLQSAQVRGAGRKLEMNGLKVGHCPLRRYSAASAACRPHSAVSRRM